MSKNKTLAVVGNYLDRHIGALFILPGILMLGIVIVYPIISNISLSFTNSHLLRQTFSFVGLRNYRELLSDPNFYSSLGVTVIYTLGALVVQFTLGMICGLLLDGTWLKWNGLFRTLIYIPYTLPIIVVTLLWRWMLNRFYGVMSGILISTGLMEQSISWLSNPATVMPITMLVTAWFGYPLIAVSVLAGLQTIPREYYEVAQINGARYRHVFWYVILPSIRRIVTIMLLLRTIWIFNTFDLVYLLTGGGPSRRTEVLTIYGYNLGWSNFQLGKTAALSVILLLILVVLISMYLRVFRMEDEQ